MLYPRPGQQTGAVLRTRCYLARSLGLYMWEKGDSGLVRRLEETKEGAVEAVIGV